MSPGTEVLKVGELQSCHSLHLSPQGPLCGPGPSPIAYLCAPDTPQGQDSQAPRGLSMAVFCQKCPPCSPLSEQRALPL